MLRCSRCQHVFSAPSSAPAATPSRPRRSPAGPREDANLTLPFEDPAWKDDAEPEPAHDLRLPEAEEEFVLGTEEGGAEPGAPAGAPFAPPARTAAAVADDEPHGDTKIARRRASEPAKTRLLFVFLGLVVAGYATLALALLASPSLADRFLGGLPAVGLAGDRLLTRKIALSDIAGRYAHIKDGKRVFVITGAALNTAPVPLHTIQIVGTLLGPGDVPLVEQRIYCGTAISAKVLNELTPLEVSIVQKLSPPKRFTIEPGVSSSFVIVFMDPPRDAAEFRVRVGAARRQA